MPAVPLLRHASTACLPHRTHLTRLIDALPAAPAASALGALVVLVAAQALPMPAQAAPQRAAARALDTVHVPSCSWSRPGHNPFMGDVVAAVDRYTDIPADVRSRLKRRMAQRDYDDIAVIRRDSLEGKYSYEPTIRSMHFGTNRLCDKVSRSAWPTDREERGLVYCEGTECIIVPTVCRNVSRVTREEPRAVAGSEFFAPEEIDPAALAAPPMLADAAPPVLPTAGVAPGDSFGALSGVPLAALGPIIGGGGWGTRVPLFRVAPPQPGWPAPPVVPPVLPPSLPPGITTPVPEPGTWALMLLGLALCAVLERLRARTIAA